MTGIVVGDAVGLTESAARFLALLALLALPLAAWHRSGLKPVALLAAGLLGTWAQARQTFSTDAPALRTAYRQATASAEPDELIEREGASAAPWLAEGQVVGTVERTAAGIAFRLAVDRLGPPQAAPLAAPWVAAEPPLAVLVTVSGWGREPLWPGDRVRLAATLHEPGGYLNPGGWERRRHLASLGIQAVASLDAAALLRLAEPFSLPAGSLGRRWAWLELATLRWAAQARVALLEAIERHLLGARPELATAASTERSALLAALTLGERGPLLRADARRDQAQRPTIDAIFRAAGIFHILSVSGLHLAVAGWVFYRGLAWLLLLLPVLLPMPSHRIAAAAAIPAVLFYTLLTGAELPTVRAAVAAVLWLLAVVCGRRARLAEALAGAVLFIVHPQPGAASALALYEPSLLLSLAATLAIGYLRPLSAFLRWSGRPLFRSFIDAAAANRWQGLLLRTSDASLAATLATLPLCAAYFAQVQPLGLFGNLLAVPIGELLVLPLGLLGALVATVWPLLGAPLLAIAGRAAGLMLEVASLLWRLGLSWFVPSPSSCQLGLWALGLIGFALRRSALGIGLCFIALGFYFADSALSAGRLEVTFLDVGQGDATVIELPHGGVIVIDAGPGSAHEGGRSLGELVVAPLLHRRGHRRIDLLIASHRHPDHIGGLAALLAQFPVDTLWLPPAAGTSIGGREATALERAWAQVTAAAARQGTRVRPPQELVLDGVTISVEAPCVSAQGPAGTCVLRAQPGWRENDNSLVLRLTYAGRALLFPGDLELAGELALLEQSDRGMPVAADVLKAPHHCSRTSSSESFVKAVSPAWVVCSVGRNNHFGFPHEEVLRRYREVGSNVLRTDRQGASTVTISPDGTMRVGSVDGAALGWLALHFPLAFRGVRR